MRSSKTKMSALAIVGGVLLAGAVNDGLGQWPPVISDPVPLNTNATSDSEWEWNPQLTTDRYGYWVSMWDFDDDLVGTIGTDADMLSARSIKNGATWTNRRQPLRSPLTNLRHQVPPRVSAPASSASEAGHGSIVAWGLNDYGQCDVPAPNTDFVAVVDDGDYVAEFDETNNEYVYDWPVCPCDGDINNDEVVDWRDVECVVEGIVEDPLACPGGDVNCDGVIDGCDLAAVECQEMGGGAECCDAPCGACCPEWYLYEAFRCVQTTAAVCAAGDPHEYFLWGSYQGDGVPCDPNPCPGSFVVTITVPIPSPMGVGVGIAADCESPPNLYYTNSFQTQLHKTDWQGNNLGSVPMIDAATSTPISFGGITWDNFRKVIWAGTDNSGIPCKVYQVDPDTGVATYAFTAHTPGCCGFCDGIDYDLGTDSIYVSDDVSNKIDEHDAATGAWIRTLTPTDAGGATLGLISGVQVGKDDLLYLGRDGLGEIVQVKKSDGSFIGPFATVSGRNADLACDSESFAPLTVIWSKDAYNDTVTAITVEPGTCVCAQPPDSPTQPAGEAGYEKVRYISMVPGNPGRLTALRVHLKDLSAPFDVLNCTKCWVGQPATYCENSGVVSPPCPPVTPTTDFMGANLQGTPHCMDWSTVGVLHVTDDDIVPAAQPPGGVFDPAIYDVQAIDCTCDFAIEANYSTPPLTITTSKWGDLVGHCAVIPCTPPDTVVGIATDVTACLDKFRNLGPPANNPSIIKSRADIEPNLPDWLINIADVTQVLDAFRGFAYPAAQTPPAPGWPGPDGCP